MKLTIGHKEIVAGIVMFLDSRGVQGFNPETVHADFTLSRGDNRQLTCTLDEDAPVAEQPKVVAGVKSSAASAATTAAAPVQPQATVTPAAVVEPEPETQAAVEPEAALEQAIAEAQPEAPVDEAENLFG